VYGMGCGGGWGSIVLGGVSGQPWADVCCGRDQWLPWLVMAQLLLDCWGHVGGEQSVFGLLGGVAVNCNSAMEPPLHIRAD